MVSSLKPVWIALVEVRPIGELSPLSDGAKGAFVNALASAIDSSEYMHRVKMALSQMHLDAADFEDVEVFDNRAKRESVSEELYDLAQEASDTDTVIFSSFHNFLTD